VVHDRGSCGPRYIRSTLNYIPFTHDLLNNSAMPLAVVISPMALPHPKDDPIPVRPGHGVSVSVHTGWMNEL
jgi:protein transport protein SEC24